MSRYRVRTFFRESGGAIRRFPVSKLDRLFARADKAREFAGKEVRFATVLVIDESRQVGVRIVDATRLRFDRAGKLSRASYESMRRAYGELASDAEKKWVGTARRSVLLATQRAPKRHVTHRSEWRPTDGEKNEMIHLTLKSLR
jgi:hypothetical protein